MQQHAKGYEPRPIDTSGIALDKDIFDLLEKLAKHNHDIWAMQRLGQGWKFGPHRDDAAKEHPDLVPYEELSETEKDYDRKTATEVLKAILALGYQIVKKRPAASSA